MSSMTMSSMTIACPHCRAVNRVAGLHLDENTSQGKSIARIKCIGCLKEFTNIPQVPAAGVAHATGKGTGEDLRPTA